MAGITYDDLLTGAVVATAIDLKSNSHFVVSTRKASRCLFFDRFTIGQYEMQLRLDWSDIDPNGNPVLDADFYSATTGKRKKSLNSNPAHHTTATTLGKRIYEWKYSDVEFEILVQVTWNVSISESANLLVWKRRTIHGQSKGRRLVLITSTGLAGRPESVRLLSVFY